MKYKQGDTVTIIKPTDVENLCNYCDSTSSARMFWVEEMDYLIGLQVTLKTFTDGRGWFVADHKRYAFLEDWFQPTSHSGNFSAYDRAMDIL